MRHLAAFLVVFTMAGCWDSHGGGGVDAESTCSDLEYWKCIRDQAAGRTTTEESNACMLAIESTCRDATWPPGCAPAAVEAEDCIFLLRRSDLIGLTYEELTVMYDDCNLCS